MSQYEITVIGEVREIYVVEADSEREARDLFTTGRAAPPVMSETSSAEIVDVEGVE